MSIDLNKTFCKDVIKSYNFKFGMWRYHVEHFNHDHTETKNDNLELFVFKDVWSLFSGTKVWKFYDSDYDPKVFSCILWDEYVEVEELEKLILKDKIDWVREDPYDYKDYLILKNDNVHYWGQFDPEDRNYENHKPRHIDHGYPEMLDPYDTCPCCGAKFECDFESEDADDFFNGYGGSNEDGPYGYYEEVHTCPECGKRFFIAVDY